LTDPRRRGAAETGLSRFWEAIEDREGIEFATEAPGELRQRKELQVCGIIGYVGGRECKPILLGGLERLEYRGYDSAGLALLERNGLDYVRAVGNLDFLKAASRSNGSQSNTGVGHTRWATHGRVCEENAHPLEGCEGGKVAVVLNGIVENFIELKESLQAEGHTFHSETDAEVVVHLVERHYAGDLTEAVRAAYLELEGHFAFVVIHYDHPQTLVGARQQCPLVVGVGESESFLASSIAAFLGETRRVQLIEDREIVTIVPEGASFVDVETGEPRARDLIEVDWDDEGAEKQGYETFMLKEIYEQPDAVRETIGERVRHGRLALAGIGLSDDELRSLDRIVILACGTAYHAGVVGRYVIEDWARVSVEPDIASEWRYRNPVLGPNTLVIGISQSGETADTIAALRLARESGARTLAITNMMGTQITREVDSVLYTRAGLEMGVAASKTFTAQVSLLYLIALKLAQVRATLPDEQIAALIAEVDALPEKMAYFLDGHHPIEEVARRHYDKPFFLYLGRHIGLPVCLEGALKLKEISYIPTEAYSAGEMKHGPIALLDEETPVVCVATDSHVYDKVVSNIQETRARGAQVIAIATDGNEDIQHHADDVIFVPRTHPFLQAVLAVLPLQLLAYRIARLRGLNVDQPRNLAKTVTVE
jgi:glucosamine--fructose-6-phosphate aminotransferase (isomerizing)